MHPTPAELRRMAPAARLARAVEVAAALPAHSPYADYLYWLRRWDAIAAQPAQPARPARPRAAGCVVGIVGVVAGMVWWRGR